MTCSNCSEREESYDIITASIKYFGDSFTVPYKEVGDTFVPYKEVGDMFVPYMEAWFPLASNNEIIGKLFISKNLIIISKNHQHNILCEPQKLGF